MSNPRNRTLPDVLSMYFVMLVVYCSDLFVLKSDLTVLGDYFYSRFVSLAILFFYVKIKKQSLRILGITKDKKKSIAGLIYGSLFSVFPVFSVTLSELFYYVFTDVTAITLCFETPNLHFVRMDDAITPTMAVVIYMLTTFSAALFKELFFRGFVLKRLNSVMNFRKANFIQAVLYMSFILPYLLRNLVNNFYDEMTIKIDIFIVVFYLVHETLTGIKWGFLTRVTGCTYAAIVDHFFYVFLSNSIFITNRYVKWSFMIHMLAIQLVSLSLVLIYYKINLKKITAKKQEKENNIKIKQDKEEKVHREILKNENERHKYIDEKIGKSEAISPDNFRKISDSEKREKYSSDFYKSKYKQTSVNNFSGETDSQLILDLYDAANGESKDEKVSDKEADIILNKFVNEHSKNYESDIKAIGSVYSAESEDIDDNLSDEDIDRILKSFSHGQAADENIKRRKSEYQMTLNQTDEIGEDFDVDKFLAVYQNSVSCSRQPHHSPHLSRHDHHTQYRKKSEAEIEAENSNREIGSLKQGNTVNDGIELKSNIKEKKNIKRKKPKKFMDS